MDYSDGDEPTTEQITAVQINQLKEAWQRANAELLKYKDIAYNLQQKVENLAAVINESYSQLELETAKSQLSQLCCGNPSKPVLLVKELARLLPKMNYHSLVATAFIKTGESWIALSSSTVTQETINFKSRIFDEMLRFRSRSKTSKVTVESLPNILPLPVINYIHSGTVPATESAFVLFNDDSKGHGNLGRRSERNVSQAENLYHEAIILRMSASAEEGFENEIAISDRCVWLVTAAPQYQANSGIDIYTDEIPMRRLAVDQFGAHPLVLSGGNDYFSKDAAVSEIPAAASNFWYPLLDYTSQLVMTALLHQFEAKRMQTQVLQSDAVAEFSNLLNNSTAASAELVLEAAGASSYASSAHLLETMSQRSEEDDILQNNTLLDDAHWDRVWQSVPEALEDFLAQHIEGLNPRTRVAADDSDDSSSRVQRTCRCEIYIGSSTLINELCKTTTSGSEAAYARAEITAMPILNSKRVVSMLKLNESEAIDGHIDALNTVLRSALLKDLPAVQSYSEVSFQERFATQASFGKAGKVTSASAATSTRIPTNAEKGPHVEFHTVIAVPLLRTELQDSVYQRMTVAEEHEMGSVKGCILVHVTSVLVESAGSTVDGASSYSGLATRAHPMYTASFSTNSTNTHSAYMEQIAGSYNLLESGRQPLVLGVVDVMDVLGGMLLTFLYAHNCRPINLLPMGAGPGAVAGGGHVEAGLGGDSAMTLSALMGTASTSYADASRWNNCITDGLFSLLLPGGAAALGTGFESGVGPSLESLAYTEETKTAKPGFRPLSQDHVLQHNAKAANVHAALMYHLCTLFHSDWALVFTSHVGTAGASSTAGASERSAHWAPQLATAADEDMGSLRLINNVGAVHTISVQELPVAFRSIIAQSFVSGNGHSSSSMRGQHRHGGSHEFVREIPGVKSLPIGELMPLLHVDPHMKPCIHQICDSDAVVHLHHTAALCLDPQVMIGHAGVSGALPGKRKVGARDPLEGILPPASNIVILTGRFLRGPFYTPFPSTPSVSQLNLLFQSAIARRDLMFTKDVVARLIEEKNQSLQEVAFAKSLEERLVSLHKSTLSGQSSNIASLVAFRKGLLDVLIDFFSDLHRLHFASYIDGGDGDKGRALEVVGIELVVDESTGLEEGRHRKWALSSTTADWVRVHGADATSTRGTKAASSFQRSSRKKIVQAPPPHHTLHSQLNVAEFIPAAATLTAEVVVDELAAVYEEEGAAVLHVHRKHCRHDEDRGGAQNKLEDDEDSDGEDTDPQDLIGMQASIHVHYEFPVVASSRGGGLKHGTSLRAAAAASSPAHAGNFFTSLQSSPVWMRILRNFIGSNSQALFQPLYPIYTPLKNQNNPYQVVSIDEEQQWDDDALYAQASNIAINALSTTIVHDTTRLLGPDADFSSTAAQHPHYRYLHQRKLLRQLTVAPPFSAFMLIPIRELTTTEVSAVDDDSSTDSSVSESEMDVDDVRYIHLLPSLTSPAATGGAGAEHRSYNPVANCMLPTRLNESVRDAVRSARDELSKAEEVQAAEAAGAKARRASTSAPAAAGSHRIRTSRLTVLDGGIGGVLHSYLSDLHERQHRRRAHNSAHRGNHEFDLYGYVDVGESVTVDKASGHVHGQEMALVDPHSLVLLYTPLLHSNCSKGAANGLNALNDPDDADQGLQSGDTNASLDHYYLVVCRQDRMIVPSSLVRLQTCLDELFLPSRVLAASQPWFECMSGIEQLVKAATVETVHEFKTDTVDDNGAAVAHPHEHAVTRSFPEEPHTPPRHRHMRLDVPSEMKLTYAAPVMSVEGQCQRILMETITIMKRIVGDRCLGAVGYQLRLQQSDLHELLSTANDDFNAASLSHAVTSDNYRAGREIELVRCCRDKGLVSSRNGKVMTMLQGPSKLQCPATAAHIMSRFAPTDLRNHRTAGHSSVRHGHHHHHNNAPKQQETGFAIHYVEMSSLEHIKQLQHSATSTSVINTGATPRADSNGAASPTRGRRTTNVAAVQEVLNAAHTFLRADVRVLQLLITSSPTQDPLSCDKAEPHVVASVLLYLSQSEEFGSTAQGADGDEKSKGHDLPPVSYIHRGDIIQQVADAVAAGSLHRGHHVTHHVRPPHVSSLTRGILSCVMRVGDTAGALVSSLYRQQYDFHLQAHMTRNHRSQMQLHAHRLANTLVQLGHDLSAVIHESHPAEAPHSSHTAHKSPAKNFHFGETELVHHGEIDDPELVMAQFLSDSGHQKEAAEHALEVAHEFVTQFYALKQQYAAEQQLTTEVRSKYKASVEECRRKASQFRAFFAAVTAAHSIRPLPPREDDVDSINSGLEKVADHTAAVPDLHALHTTVANVACNTQILRKALEVLSELAAHEEFSAFFNTLLSGLSQCASDDASGNGSQLISGSEAGAEEGEEYDGILQLLDLTPFAAAKKLSVEEKAQSTGAPDISATVWWVLEPGSHINAINLANSVQTVGNSLDANTLHSKEKFIEALNTKQPVFVEGEELLRMLPHLLAYFSANGHEGSLPSIRLLYQPVLATLPTEDDEVDDASYSSADEGDDFVVPGETIVVAVVQYVISGGLADVRGHASAAGGEAGGAHGTRDDGSSIGGGGSGGLHPLDQHESSLADIMRQVGRERVEQAIAYMGQHITLHSKITAPDVVPAPSQVSRSTRYTQNALAAAMNQFVPRLLQENNLISGIQYSAMISALRFVIDPVNFAPPSAPAPLPQAMSKDSQSRSSVLRRSKGSSGSVSSAKRRSSGGSVKNLSISSRGSDRHKAHNAEKIAAAAVYSPISVWVGKLLATMMRADAASMLHISGSVKPTPKARPGSSSAATSAANSDNEAGAERHSTVVYEGVLYNYGHGVVTGGAVSDERHTLNILHVRPSSWTPLQSLIDKYHTFFRSNTGPDSVFVTYQESVLSYARRTSSGPVYSSRSAASQSGASVVADSSGTGSGKFRYILACSINTSSVTPNAAAAGSSALSNKNVRFTDTEEDAQARSALKENDDFIVVELSRRPSSADMKAFQAVAQLVQAFIWTQTQRNHIKLQESELSSISGALATTSQRLVEEQRENQLHRQYDDVMLELQRQLGRSLTTRSAASASSIDSGADAYPPPGGEFTPRVSDILQCVQKTQDLLCEALGEADVVALLPAPRLNCQEMRNLFKADTMSVASRGSSGVDDELLGSRIDTVTRNISKRALARLMAADYFPGPNGVNTTEYFEAAEAQYQVARINFAALAVQLNQVLVCDVGDIIAEEAASLGLNLNKTIVPAVARSIMVPVIDHAPEPAVVSTQRPAAHGAGDVEFYGDESEDSLPTSRLCWLDADLKKAVSSVLGTSEGQLGSPDPRSQGAYYQQYYFDQRPKAAKPNPAVSSTCHNSAHAWAVQIVFPTLEARDQYVTVLLGGAAPQTADNSSQLSTPSTSPFSSPLKSFSGRNSTQAQPSPGKGSSLPMSFVSGLAQYLKNSFVLSRNYVREDVALMQARLEQHMSDKVSGCMDQVLLMTTPGCEIADSDAEQPAAADDSLEFSVDTIAAAVAHVFKQLKGKVGFKGDSAGLGAADDASSSDDEDAAAPPPPTSATFECDMGDAQLHWTSQPEGLRSKTSHGPSVRFHDAAGDGASSQPPVGMWLTVAFHELPEKQPTAAAEESKSGADAKLDSAVKSTPGRGGKATPSTQRGKVHHVEPVVEEELLLVPEGFKVHRDKELYKRCRERQWRTQRSPLTAQQIQAVKDCPEGFLLFALPATTPHVHKPKRARSTSPASRGAHNTSYTSSSRQLHYGGQYGQREDRDAQDEATSIGAYMNADGTVHLQLLLLVTGSEQLAILEMRLKCHVTAGASRPEQLLRNLTRRRSKKRPLVPADELALAEMVEQVACDVLQPALPTLRLVRSSVAHLLEHSVAARGLVAWEADWDQYLQHAQQRISLLSNSMTLLTSEGHKAPGLLQLMQEALCRLPSLHASTLICRDSITNQILYNRTMDYSSNTASDFNAAPATPADSTSGQGGEATGRSGFLSPIHGGSNFTFPDSAFAPGTGGTSSPSHRVSYMDISRRKESASNLVLALGTPVSQRGQVESLKDQFGHVHAVNPALDTLEQLEIVFECYEVQGSLTVYFTPEYAARAEEDATPVNLFSPASTAGRSWSPSKHAPHSPYEPLRSPSTHRRAREEHRHAQINTSVVDPLAPSPGPVSSGDAAGDGAHRDLVSLNTLLETITRAMARRVFELHRGNKNKKMMATKQQELSKRTSQLAKQDEKVETLEAMNNMSRQELQNAAAESERLRLLMYAEQRNLKEALKQKKEMNAHLRQSLLELRQESDTRALIAKKQQQELREKIRGLELAREKEQKELDRVRKREVVAETSTNTLTQQVAEMQRLQKTAEGTVRQLRVDLAAAQKELAAAQARDRTRNDSEDSRIQGFLQKISKLDEELVAARGTNAFMKKQLDATALQLKLAEDERVRLAQEMRTASNSNSGSSTSRVVTSFSSTAGVSSAAPAFAANPRSGGSSTPVPQVVTTTRPRGEVGAASPLYEEMAESLQREQEHTAMLRRQLQEMQLEGVSKRKI